MGDTDIEMPNIPPTAYIDIDQSEYYQTGKVILCAGRSVNPDGDFHSSDFYLEYYWDFINDGSWDMIGGPIYSYLLKDIYGPDTEYTVKLMVKEREGNTDTVEKSFKIIKEKSCFDEYSIFLSRFFNSDLLKLIF